MTYRIFNVLFLNLISSRKIERAFSVAYILELFRINRQGPRAHARWLGTAAAKLLAGPLTSILSLATALS